MRDIERLIEFVRFANKFRLIERVYRTSGSDRRENDAEHSYQLALAAWHIISTKKLALDADKAVRYALVHDLVEIYAGDTYHFTTDAQERSTKDERESAAMDRIRSEFPEFPDLHDAIGAYQSKSDAESRFVYVLDKLLPPINIYLDDGWSNKRHKVTLEMFVESVSPKIALSPELKPYFDMLLEFLREREESAFFTGDRG